jgi:LPXTG-site transpeptidase (sortase) family protein
LEIPKIDLVANVSEGTSSEVLNQYIGHFEETQKQNGNIVLAAHNRGYDVNYFQRLKELEIGDIVFYTYLGNKRKYVVNEKNIIKDTDVNILENTKDNRITLITCVENMPELRRCIKAIEVN